MKVLIVADGDFVADDVVHASLLEPDADGRPMVIAADGGALKAERAGLRPDLVVGDADSLEPEAIDRLRRGGVEVRIHPRAKDESDTELAVREALDHGATKLVILGALGGLRFDHALANLLLLTLPELAGRDVVLADGPTTVRAVGSGGPGNLELAGRPGDLVSLLPLSEEVAGVRTVGLRYPLAGDTLAQGPSRGLSNVMQADAAAISVERGRLAVIHTRRAEGANDG